MPPKVSEAAAGAFAVSAGLDLISGVTDYLQSINEASAANSRADLIRMNANANARRYAEKEIQFQQHEEMMFLASGVKISGSPIDVLDTTARIAKENIDSITMAGEREALDQQVKGTEAEIQGRNALLGSVSNALGMGAKAFETSGIGAGGGP